MKIYNSIAETIGNTPLIKLSGVMKEYNCNANILAKLESFNPAGSAKDRVAYMMIKEAEESGILTQGSIIIEPTSGNTGIGLALVAKSKGYRVILTMPESMSIERRKLLKAYGAELVLTDKALGMTGAIQKAEELALQIPGSFIPNQFSNPANTKAHYETTGPEIWRDTDGTVDVFVSAVGTGGTVSGVGKFLKEQNPNIKIYAVEPSASPVLSGGAPSAHKIQGIGAGFIPAIYNKSVVDAVIGIADEKAFEISRAIAKFDNIPVGISSGAAVAAAIKLSDYSANSGKNIVVILPDSGERYLSTELFE